MHKCYAQLDIVSFDGAACIAWSDNPGLCPGAGWEPLSKRGRQGRPGDSITGPQGEKGATGEKGDDAAEIVDWCVDEANYRVVGFRSDGKPVKELSRALIVPGDNLSRAPMKRLSPLQRAYWLGLRRARAQAQRERDEMADESEGVIDEIHAEMRGVRDELTKLRTLALIEPCDTQHDPAKHVG